MRKATKPLALLYKSLTRGGAVWADGWRRGEGFLARGGSAAEAAVGLVHPEV